MLASKSLILHLLFLITQSGDVDFSQDLQDWQYLAEIIREETYCISDPAEKLAAMTDWLHRNVKHVAGGRYPKGFNSRTVVTIIKGGYGNCGYQSSNIVGIAKMLGLNEHRVLHHKKVMGAPAIHAFAEIKVEGRWIIYDPDKFLYFRDESDALMGVKDVAEDLNSWVGISEKNNGYIERKSGKKVPTGYNYYHFERHGTPYILMKTKMEHALSALQSPISKVQKNSTKS